jgi:hypothetical protein
MGGILAALGLAAVLTVSVAAAAPNVNTGSGITVDGSFADWTEADFFADMYRAGDSSKEVESKLYLRYDCTAGILYVRVDPVDGVTIIETDGDNFVKFGNDDKKVDGSDAPPDATQPNFAYAPNNGGWEASFAIAAPVSITDLNVHAQVEDGGAQTSAVANRAIPMNITCTTLTSVTAAPATITGPSCTAAGTLVIPADTASVMYSVSPAYTAGAFGPFTVTATAKAGFVLTGTSQWMLTVAPQLTGVACATSTAAAAASITPPSCTAAGTLVIPANTASVTYSVSPAYTAGASGTFTVTATANAGFVLSGTSQSILTVAPQVTGAACITGGGTLPGNPATTPVRSGTLASSLPNTAMDGSPVDQAPIVLLSLVALGSLAYVAQRNIVATRSRR